MIDILDSGIGRLEGGNFALIFEKAQVDDDDTLEDALTYVARTALAAFDEARPGYAVGQKKEERIRQLQRKGVWINAPDGEGWVLADPQSQSPVVNNKGHYLRVRPGDVRALASGRSAERDARMETLTKAWGR